METELSLKHRVFVLNTFSIFSFRCLSIGPAPKMFPGAQCLGSLTLCFAFQGLHTLHVLAYFFQIVHTT